MKRDRQSECGGCGTEELILLYHVRHRGIYRRLCTACIFKFHPGSFCPICFEVYNEPLPPSESVFCVKCPSVSHSNCVGPNVSPRYECPPCANSNFVFFQTFESFKKNKPLDAAQGFSEHEPSREIDQNTAKILVTAARIASTSMSKAANMARVESERRIRETILAKKRAKEALERVSHLSLKEKKKNQVQEVARESVICKTDPGQTEKNRELPSSDKDHVLGSHKAATAFLEGNHSRKRSVQDGSN